MTTQTAIPMYREQQYTIAEVGDKLQGQNKVKHIVMAMLPGSQTKWGDQYNVKDTALAALLTVGKSAVFILRRESLKKPDYDGAKDWHYYWGLIGVRPEYVPAEYEGWCAHNGRPTTPAPTAPAQPSAAQAAPQQAAKGAEAPAKAPRDATRISIERQVALKCATDIMTAGLTINAQMPQDAPGLVQYTTALAQGLYDWLADEQPKA